MSKFNAGDKIVVNLPGHPTDGATGRVNSVLPKGDNPGGRYDVELDYAVDGFTFWWAKGKELDAAPVEEPTPEPDVFKLVNVTLATKVAKEYGITNGEISDLLEAIQDAHDAIYQVVSEPDEPVLQSDYAIVTDLEEGTEFTYGPYSVIRLSGDKVKVLGGGFFAGVYTIEDADDAAQGFGYTLTV